MSTMTAADFHERLQAVTQTHKMLNARRKYPSEQREMAWFLLGCFAVVGLLGFLAIVRF